MNFMVPKKYLTSLMRFQSYSLLRLYSRNTVTEKQKNTLVKKEKPRVRRILNYFANKPHFNDVKSLIPIKHLTSSPKPKLNHLYLVDKDIAVDSALHILPFLLKKPGAICETNSGLGLISSELLSKGINFIRLYESCSEFRKVLAEIHKVHPHRVEIFSKDLFYLWCMSYMDRLDHGNRVDALLQGVSRNNWKGNPVMTIIGPMPNFSFLTYLLKMVAYQCEIINYGRIQLFVFITPKQYLKLTSNAGDSLKQYKSLSVLFQLFFDWHFLEKYPRRSFLPWESNKQLRLENDYMYLVHMEFKKILPVEVKNLLHLYYFVTQGFGRGKPKVIPTVEKWFPGIGIDLIAPTKPSRKICQDFSIFTEFGQLSPKQILQIFVKTLERPDYKTSPFMALIDSLTLKTEAIMESDVEKRK